MKGRMQKIPMLKEVQFERGNLLEYILSPYNLNRAYLQVKRNHGSGGVDGLSTEQLGDYLREHKDELVESLKTGRYRPNPVRRVEIPAPSMNVSSATTALASALVGAATRP